MPGNNREREQMALTPPRWVKACEIIREWAQIAHVRVIGCNEYDQAGRRQVTFTVEGAADDIAVFGRIVKRNTADWQ